MQKNPSFTGLDTSQNAITSKKGKLMNRREPGCEMIWKDVPGYEGNYIISNMGVIKSLRHRHGNRKTPRVVSQSLVGGGKRDQLYLGVNLYKESVLKRLLVHRVIALVFIPNPLGKPHVNHINLNRLDNSIANLEWVSHRENICHQRQAIIRKPIGIWYSKNRPGKKWVSKVSVNNKTVTIGYFATMEDAAKAYTNFLGQRNESNRYAS
jgi:hypothetical protein